LAPVICGNSGTWNDSSTPPGAIGVMVGASPGAGPRPVALEPALPPLLEPSPPPLREGLCEPLEEQASASTPRTIDLVPALREPSRRVIVVLTCRENAQISYQIQGQPRNGARTVWFCTILPRSKFHPNMVHPSLKLHDSQRHRCCTCL
jgi:hypothetical protein